MPIDTKRFPMLGDPSNPPTCKECDAALIRVGDGAWLCGDWYCDAPAETDAQLDNRLQSLAEAAHERRYNL